CITSYSFPLSEVTKLVTLLLARMQSLSLQGSIIIQSLQSSLPSGSIEISSNDTSLLRLMLTDAYGAPSILQELGLSGYLPDSQFMGAEQTFRIYRSESRLARR